MRENIDALTGCYTRSHLSTLDSMPAGYSLIFIDLDKFKPVNDLLGHAAGDMVLAKIADIFKKNLRSDDIVLRYGGDEFVIILPGVTPAAAEKTVDRLLAVWQKNHPDTGHLRVGFSAGVIQGTGDINHDIAAADKIMYEAKQGSNINVPFEPKSQVAFVTPKTVQEAVEYITKNKKQSMVVIDTNRALLALRLTKISGQNDWRRWPAAKSAFLGKVELYSTPGGREEKFDANDIRTLISIVLKGISEGKKIIINAGPGMVKELSGAVRTARRNALRTVAY